MCEVEVRVHCEDCISYMRKQPEKSYDLIIADPPYFEIHGDFDFVWKDVEEYLNWSREWIREAHRILKDTGSFYLWGKIGFGKGFALFRLADWFESEGLFKVRNWITQRNCRGRGTKRGYMEAREELVFSTKTDSYTWNVAYTSEKSKRKDLGFDGKPRKNEFKRVSDVWIDIAEASQSSLQRFSLRSGKPFPTVKALGLCERIILASSDVGDRVYIPFGGSGSEAIACASLRRDWDLTESNSEYVEELILPRVRKETIS
jgi:site-specific DNA-methyltransferase (adenine-specific)